MAQPPKKKKAPTKKEAAAPVEGVPKVAASKKEISAKATGKKGAKKEKAPKVVTKEDRLALIKGWKKRRLRGQMKAEKRLSNYIDRLVEKYPKDFMEKIKAGLEDESKFAELAEELKFDMDSSAAETDEEFLERFSRTLGLGGDD